jgi:hypothetical protein
MKECSFNKAVVAFWKTDADVLCTFSDSQSEYLNAAVPTCNDLGRRDSDSLQLNVNASLRDHCMKR